MKFEEVLKRGTFFIKILISFKILKGNFNVGNN